MPKDLNVKIKRFLDFNFELKKDLKIEENEVMSLLNDDLKGTLAVYYNGRILKSVAVFSEFSLEFLSSLTFVLNKRTYTSEEYIFNEEDESKEIYFIT